MKDRHRDRKTNTHTDRWTCCKLGMLSSSVSKMNRSTSTTSECLTSCRSVSEGRATVSSRPFTISYSKWPLYGRTHPQTHDSWAWLIKWKQRGVVTYQTW